MFNEDIKQAARIELREHILGSGNFEIHKTSVPKDLTTRPGSEIFVDAIIQAVELLGYPSYPDVDSEDAFNAAFIEAMNWTIAVAGLLLIDGHVDAKDGRFFQKVQRAVTELSGSAVKDNTVQIDGHHVIEGNTSSAPIDMFAPSANKTQRIKIYTDIATILGEFTSPFSLQSYAATGRAMADRYGEHEGEIATLRQLSQTYYTQHVHNAASGSNPIGVADVALPPLNDPHGYNDEIERENIQAVSTIYVSYQLEQMMVHRVCDRILELFMAGLLPINASDGSARSLDRLYWDREDLLDEASRRSAYSRVLGAPGGQIAMDVQPNTEFNTLLMRVISSIAEYDREQSMLTFFDEAAKGNRYRAVSGEFVRQAMRDFAANASLRGWAGTAFTAERLAKQVGRIMNILQLPAIQNAFGVSTPWQVVERVAQREFGITVNVVLHRTIAVETQVIMDIAARNHTIWTGSHSGKELFSRTQRNDGDLSLDDTTKLVIASQHFRAVSGMQTDDVYQLSQPVETVAAPSLPAMGSAGGGGGGMVDMAGIDQIRDMVSAGQAPSMDQLRSLLPGF